MPKASKEETIKKKIRARALYEKGGYTQEQIAKTVGITDKTLRGWIKEDANDVWKEGSLQSEVYDIAKINQKNKILRNFKKEEDKVKDDVLMQKAEEDGLNEAVEIINLTKERNKVMKTTLENASYINEYLINLVKKGKTAKITEEDVMLHGKAVEGMKKQIKTVEEHKVLEIVRACEMLGKTLHELGFFAPIPDNNNNTNTQQAIEYTAEQLQDVIKEQGMGNIVKLNLEGLNDDD